MKEQHQRLATTEYNYINLPLDMDTADAKAIISQHFELLKEVQDKIKGSQPEPTEAKPVTQTIEQNASVLKCGICGSDVWNNKAKKDSKEFSPKSPDYACKDKECGAAYWESDGIWKPKK